MYCRISKRITTNETHVKSVIECAALAKMSFYNEPLPMTPQRPNAFYFKDGLCWLSAVSGPKGAYLESAQPLPKNHDSAYGLRGCLGNFLSVVTYVFWVFSSSNNRKAKS